MTAAGDLAVLLRDCPDAPVEMGGTREVLEDITGGGPISARIRAGRAPVPAARELELLQARAKDPVHVRSGVLSCDAGLAVAEVTELVVTGRVPARARPLLGITRRGTLVPGQSRVQIATALRGLGVRRQLVSVALTPDARDDHGDGQPVCVTALLRVGDGRPLALTVERVCAALLEKYPPPWPR